MINKIDRLRGGLVYSKALGMFNLNRGSNSCRRTPACKDCYVNRSCQAYKLTKKAWTPGGTDDKNWSKASSEIFEGLGRVRIASRGEALRTKADVDRVVEWVKDNPNTLFWIPTRAIYKNRGKDLDQGHMEYIEYHLASLPNARVLASLDPFTAHHWPMLEKRMWSTMFYESKNVPKGYKFKGTHPAKGQAGAKIHFCTKTWDLYFADNGRVVGPKGSCATCENGCFELSRVDVWLRNHARSPKNSSVTDKLRAMESLNTEA